CGLHYPLLFSLVEQTHNKENDVGPAVLERQELQRATFIALEIVNRVMRGEGRRKEDSLKKNISDKTSMSLGSSIRKGNTTQEPRHSKESLTPPQTPPIPQSLSLTSKPTESTYSESELKKDKSDHIESWLIKSALESVIYLSTMARNGKDRKPFDCPVFICKKLYHLCNYLKYHAKNKHR
uniref:C2H2-type domain-containing protein n=1 Tax=Pongo abelii TaxID=9601 RepID=A0A8I5YSI6_PONAB